jgi:hypothetical protein
VSQRNKFAIYADKIKKNRDHAMSAGYGPETTSQIWTSNPDRWMNDVPTEEPIQGAVLGGRSIVASHAGGMTASLSDECAPIELMDTTGS